MIRRRVPVPLAPSLLVLAWSLLAAAPLAAQEQGTEDAEPHRPNGPRVIVDPRLEADSTIFPHEWPALVVLRSELRQLRPALEGDSVVALVAATPRVTAAAERLAADTVPAPLAARSQELRGRIVALHAALADVERGAAAALASPPFVEGGGVPDDSGLGTRPAPAEEGLARLPPSPAGSEIAPPIAGQPPAAAPAPGDTAAGEGAMGEVEVDPRAAYLEAWRDVVLHAEALVHALRDPAGEPDPEPTPAPVPEDEPGGEP